MRFEDIREESGGQQRAQAGSQDRPQEGSNIDGLGRHYFSNGRHDFSTCWDSFLQVQASIHFQERSCGTCPRRDDSTVPDTDTAMKATRTIRVSRPLAQKYAQRRELAVVAKLLGSHSSLLHPSPLTPDLAHPKPTQLHHHGDTSDRFNHYHGGAFSLSNVHPEML